MPRKKQLEESDYQKLKRFLISKSNQGGVSRQEIFEYMNITKFSSILELIYTFATLEEIKKFKIIDNRSKKFFEFDSSKCLNSKSQEQSNPKDDSESSVLSQTGKNSSDSCFEDVMKYDEDSAYALELEKSLPLGLVDMDNLPAPYNRKINQNVVFDLSILKYPMETFLKILSDITNPKILIPETLIDEIDKVNHKNSSYSKEQKQYAKSILKFIAEDKEDNFSRLDRKRIKNENANVLYAEENDAIIISNNPRTIAFAKVRNVKTIVFDSMKEHTPFDPNSEFVCGVDASIISYDVDELKKKFFKYRSILISDITISELEKVIDDDFTTQEKESARFIIQCAAFWGEVKNSRLRLCSADKSIVNFYYENPVSIVLTGDFGFGGNARLFKVNYEIQLRDNYQKSDLTTFFSSQNPILNKIVEKENLGLKLGIISANETCIEIDTFDFLLKKIIANVFSQSGELKETKNNIVKVYPNDIVVLKAQNQIAIILLTNSKNAIGKVWYCGDIKDIPEKYKKYLV